MSLTGLNLKNLSPLSAESLFSMIALLNKQTIELCLRGVFPSQTRETNTQVGKVQLEHTQGHQAPLPPAVHLGLDGTEFSH